MKEATRDDAAAIAHLLDVNKESVWEIIKGMKFTAQSELAMAVHVAFQNSPLATGTLQNPTTASTVLPRPQVLHKL